MNSSKYVSNTAPKRVDRKATKASILLFAGPRDLSHIRQDRRSIGLYAHYCRSAATVNWPSTRRTSIPTAFRN